MIFKFRKYKIAMICLVFFAFFALTGCENISKFDQNWNMITKSAQNTNVNLYLLEGVGADSIEFWIQDVLKPQVLKSNGIELHLKKLPLEDMVAMLDSDKKNESKSGMVDLIAVSEADITRLVDTGFLYKDFVTQIKNVDMYMDLEDLDVQYAEDVSLKNSAVPFNKGQLLFCYNDDIIYEFPKDYDELKELITNKKGIFTYPHVKTSLGSKFVRSVILNFMPAKEFMNELSEQELADLVKPGMQYLKTIEPYLYNGGLYPDNMNEYVKLYAEGNIAISLSDSIRSFDNMVSESNYPETTIAFAMSNSIGKNDYFVIPENSTNKAGAMFVINEALHPIAQSEKYSSRINVGIAPYSVQKLSKSALEELNKGLRRKTFVKHVDLISIKQHDIPKKYHRQIERIWEMNFLKPSISK